MTFRYNRRVTYDEFEARVRRHRPSELLPAIAAVTAQQAEANLRPTEERLVLPWALAAAAKESLRSGNENRPGGVSDRDIQEICGAFNALEVPLLDGSRLGEIHAFFTRVSHEQFPYQLSRFEEVTRPYAIFEICGRDIQTELVERKFWLKALGCSIAQFSGVGFLLSVAAEKNAGFFHLDLLERQDLTPIFEEVPSDIVRSVTERHFSATREEIKRVAEQHRSRDHRLRRYDHNPLFGAPFVRWNDRQFLAPIVHLVLMRVATLGMYFIGLGACESPDEQDAFTRDFGAIFQAYIGRQLEALGTAEVRPEIRYEGDRRSVDWFVIWPEMVVLVEVKSTRLTQEARQGTPRLDVDINRTLGKAFEQISKSADLILAGHPAFSQVPSDRPLFGMVITLEPYYLMNSAPIRALLPKPRVPTLVAAARDIERLASVWSKDSAARFLRETYQDPEKSTWDLSSVIGTRAPDARNALLDEAWGCLPWSERSGTARI
jgi:hypothetical protein